MAVHKIQEVGYDMGDVSPLILEILNNRGIVDEDEVNEFLSEKPQLTYDPFLLPNMEEGVDFVLQAVDQNEHICIYGDYDVDGITATALLYLFLSRFTNNISYFIPSRFEDGYGLSKDALMKIKENGADCVITVDCGSVSLDEVAYAKGLGLKILVTDHHGMKHETMPDCPVINPKHMDSQYPFDGLCGCAVAFKLIQAIVRKKNLKRNILNEYLDLVAIATVADVVPLLDENRTLLKYGLREVNRLNRKAFRILTNRLGIEAGRISTYDISFIIAPHMNAAGRMEEANSVVRMLISDNNQEIENIVERLIKYNNERKSVQEKCLTESINIVENHLMDDPVLMIRPDSVHEGIAGIVAGKIKEKFNKPSIVMSLSDSKDGHILKGSGRSIEDVNMDNMLKKYKDLFLKVGGHAMAAGFSIKEVNYLKLKEALIGYMDDMLRENPQLLTKKIGYDLAVNERDICLTLTENLGLLAPFGRDNPEPVLKLENVKANKVKYMGDAAQHVRFCIENLECILFNCESEQKTILENGAEFDLFGIPGINEWNGKKNVQFKVKAVLGRKE